MNNFLAYTNKVLSNEDIKFLNDDYDKHEPQVIKRFGNLFHLEQRFPPEVHEHITSKLHPSIPVAHYYLNYTEGSFCRMHHDNDVSLTTITLIDQDHNFRRLDLTYVCSLPSYPGRAPSSSRTKPRGA